MFYSKYSNNNINKTTTTSKQLIDSKRVIYYQIHVLSVYNLQNKCYIYIYVVLSKFNSENPKYFLRSTDPAKIRKH